MPKENSETANSICRIIRISNCVKMSLHRGDSYQYQSIDLKLVVPLRCVANVMCGEPFHKAK